MNMPSGHFAEDLTGRRFGRLEVISREPNYISKTGQEAVWKCRCDCGAFRTVRAGQLRGGHATSCGCLQKERAAALHTRHGGSRTKLYGVWTSMIGRCENPADRSYPDYGGRGITLCEEWRTSFEAFRDWATAHGYEEPKEGRSKISIDRINNDGNYCPENCRWATAKEQNQNQRPRKKHSDRRKTTRKEKQDNGNN
jgi:hypothetical protein